MLTTGFDRRLYKALPLRFDEEMTTELWDFGAKIQ
jgi:hypothetical protein